MGETDRCRQTVHQVNEGKLTMEIAGKKIVITGGGRGMGRKFAEDLSRLGAKPHVLDVLEENLNALANEAGIPGSVLDVTSEADVQAFFEGYTQEHGAPDVLINNAAVFSQITMAPFCVQVRTPLLV